MNTATATIIKSVDDTLDILAQFALEIDLESILHEELELGLASDISNAF
ncbi:hypothetical protein NIES4102_06530 [Chondrocystis sp. NIES-4102]|nr:hypothetical protein NIES4102_06530 [Chondrocystis sp. NIES-4102]